MNCIIVHGSNDSEKEAMEGKPENVRHWQPWIKKELKKRGINVSADLYPKDWAPDYDNWKSVFERNKIDNDTILIGHSAGACFIIRWLSENNRKVDKIILVAPSMLKSAKYKKLRFKDFEYGSELKNCFNKLILLYSDTDDKDIIDSVKQIHEKLGGFILELKNKGHFTLRDMGTEEFPELLEEVLNDK